jgi:membrane-associated HD superfamily phosphohydrolase
VRGSQAENSHFTMGYFILFALIPNLLITDSEHFLFTLPLIVILMHALWKEGNLLLSAVFVILLFLYGCNSSDLIGNKLSDVFEKAGVLGFSNMGLVALSLFMFVKKSGVQAKAIPGLNDKTALVC